MQKLIDLSDEILATLESLESSLDQYNTPSATLDIISEFVGKELKDLVRTAEKLGDELRREEEVREEMESRIEELEHEQ